MIFFYFPKTNNIYIFILNYKAGENLLVKLFYLLYFIYSNTIINVTHVCGLYLNFKAYIYRETNINHK